MSATIGNTHNMGYIHIAILSVAALLFFCSVPVAASDPTHKSGYEDVSEIGEGPSDITDELEEDDKVKETLIELPKTPIAKWSNFSLTDLWWEQYTLEGKLSVRFGKYLPFNIFDPFSLKNPLTGFQNAAFTGTPAIAFPSFGLGAVSRVRLADEIDLVVGLNDANGKPTTSGFDTFLLLELT